MNPDDPNSTQGGAPANQGAPADTGTTGAPEPVPVTPPNESPMSTPMGGSEPMGGAPAGTPAGAEGQGMPANCHCGKPSQNGNCVGCNMPEASCNCTPAV